MLVSMEFMELYLYYYIIIGIKIYLERATKSCCEPGTPSAYLGASHDPCLERATKPCRVAKWRRLEKVKKGHDRHHGDEHRGHHGHRHRGQHDRIISPYLKELQIPTLYSSYL